MSEASIVVIKAVPDYSEVVNPDNIYTILDLDTLSKRVLSGSQIMSLDESIFANVSDGIIKKYDFSNKVWSVRFGCSLSCRLITNHRSELFCEVYRDDRLVRSGFTGGILSSPRAYFYLETYRFVICYGNLRLPFDPEMDNFYGSVYKRKERYNFNAQVDMEGIPYHTDAFKKIARRYLVVDEDCDLIYNVAYNGVEYAIDELRAPVYMSCHIEGGFLVDFKTITGGEHKVLTKDKSLSAYLILAKNMRGYRILSENTILYTDLLGRNNCVSVLWHKGFVFVFDRLVAWDKYKHNSNKLYVLDQSDSPSGIKIWARRASTGNRSVSDFYLTGVSKEDFIEMSRYFPAIFAEAGRPVLVNLAKEIHKRTHKVYNFVLDKDDLISKINFDYLDAQVDKDEFITPEYYYLNGYCVSLKNYTREILEDAYADEERVPQFKTIIAGIKSWFK